MSETALINVAERMREVMPELKKGVGDFRFPEIRPQCEEMWSEKYATILGVYYDDFHVLDCDYIDYDRIRFDFEEKAKSLFPGCKVTIRWRCQEMEIERL